jgi:non-ribosomal peptide synthetase component F
LASFIEDAGLTQWFSVPSILNHMAKLDVVRPGAFPSLQRLLWAGERFPTSGLKYWMQRLPQVRFTNLYGPTETTIASSYYEVPSCPRDEREEIPIGHGCDGEELLVLDPGLQRLPPGEIGELYIRGSGLSPGYWRDPTRTAAAFIPNPFSDQPGDRLYRTGDLAKLDDQNRIVLLGRADTQVKSRGYRIELGEIEAALDGIAELQESAVVAVRSDGFEGSLLCCAYVPRPGGDVAPTMLRQRLAEVVPGYMLPSRWRQLDRLPLNQNGKTDRSALRELWLDR